MHLILETESPMSARPTIFAFKISPAFAPMTSVELRGADLVVTGEFAAGSDFHVTPEDRHWEDFWCAADFLDVWRWKPDYDTWELGVAVDDGQEWSLQIVHGERSMKAGGRNAYPAYSSPVRSSLQEERFSMFVLALAELVSRMWDRTPRSG